MFPIARLEPLTVRVATTAFRLTVPRDAVPNVKATVPVGRVVPVAAWTVAVRTVDALCAMAGGTAVRRIVVATGGAVEGAVTVTVAVAEAFIRVALPW